MGQILAEEVWNTCKPSLLIWNHISFIVFYLLKLCFSGNLSVLETRKNLTKFDLMSMEGALLVQFCVSPGIFELENTETNLIF